LKVWNKLRCKKAKEKPTLPTSASGMHKDISASSIQNRFGVVARKTTLERVREDRAMIEEHEDDGEKGLLDVDLDMFDDDDSREGQHPREEEHPA
jgi:hypothetical protein